MDTYILFLQRNIVKRRQIRRHRTLLMELRLKSSPFDLPDVRIFGLSLPSMSRSIHVVTDLINSHLLNDAVKFPSGTLETAEIKRQFCIKFNMPGIIGVIDGTHIPIVAPSQHAIDGPGHLYVNRKGYHSLNVLVITDENLKVIYADARFPGSVSATAE